MVFRYNIYTPYFQKTNINNNDLIGNIVSSKRHLKELTSENKAFLRSLGFTVIEQDK